MLIRQHSSNKSADSAAASLEPRMGEIREWLIAAIAERTRLSRIEIRVDEPIHRYGIDSLERVNIAYQLERWIGFEVDESTLASLETIDDIAAHLAQVEAANAR